MVTCKVDSAVVPKMSRTKKTSSTSSGFRLVDGDQLDTVSSASRNSIYKIKIDSMFDDTRSIRSQHFDDRRGSHRTRSIIMYGKSELTNTSNKTTTSATTTNCAGDNHSSSTCNQSLIRKKCGSKTQHQQQQKHDKNCMANHCDDIDGDGGGDSTNAVDDDHKNSINANNDDNRRISNCVQAQIERMFTDVAKDATCSFTVRCLGSLPLKDKVTSLLGLQEPLRQLYLTEAAQGNQCNGHLDICASGLRIRQGYEKDIQITPFHNIAVWSAVKFIVSQEEGGAAFLPLITDPENIDKSSLFRPLTAADQRRLSSGLHAPIFAVVMRSLSLPKILQCHGFVCQTPEDAIVIAATLYQSLMTHVSTNSHRSTKKRTPRNQNGVSCVSIASSSVLTGSNYISRSNGSLTGNGRKNSQRSNVLSHPGGPPTPSRPARKKRIANSSLSGESDTVREIQETTTEERKKKSHKTKRAPPIPTPARNKPTISYPILINSTLPVPGADIIDFDSMSGSESSTPKPSSSPGVLSSSSNSHLNGRGAKLPPNESLYHTRAGGGDGGDILTRVAIPRSGSFLNTGGLTRYKSRATRRNSIQNGSGIGCGGGGGGGGGGSPLGFSELFNEFRLHENLHSLDDILSAIINADGMSFNDLKPIYKEFLLKLAVTLTKDELYQRSKNIMRRQKKKKLKRKNSNVQTKNKYFILGFGLKKVFRFGKFRSNKSIKSSTSNIINNQKSTTKYNDGGGNGKIKENKRNKGATSGSDFSVAKNENTLNGIHRNSSSGYVSCSECSYDSEACTCASADRCYCSMGADHDRSNDKLKQKQKSTTTIPLNNRDSLMSCKTDEKCYCSMGDTHGDDDDDDNDTTSDTTWCDTDSCNSVSKCYCRNHTRLQKAAHDKKRSLLNVKDITTTLTELGTTSTASALTATTKLKHRQPSKLGLDYELFTISNDDHGTDGNNKYNRKNRNYHCGNQPVRQHEALSVKKSVEAAALFADVKLSQTTDIKSLRPSSQSNHLHNFLNQKYSSTDNIKNLNSNKKSNGNSGGEINGGSNSSSNKNHRESKSSDRQHKSISSRKNYQQNHNKKSLNNDDILLKLNGCDNKSNYRNGNGGKSGTAGENCYQSMKAVSASLEDSLGYLP